MNSVSRRPGFMCGGSARGLRFLCAAPGPQYHHQLIREIKMRMFKAVVCAVTIALFLAGCSTHKPIYNITEAPVAASKPLDANQVKTAIVTAGGALGWRMREVSPGMLEGTLVLREHTA